MSDSGFGVVPRHVRGTLTLAELGVFVALTWRADEYGECWPSHTLLAEDAGTSTSTVKRALAGLRDKALVTWVQRAGDDGGRSSNGYRVRMYRDPVTHPLDHGDLPPGSRRPAPPVTVTEGVGHGDLRIRAIERDTGNETQGTNTRPRDGDYPAAFREFWDAYPRNVGKRAAFKAWEKAVKRAPAGVITAGARRFADDPNLPADRNFIKHPQTWLNGDCWEDEPLPPREPRRGEIDWDAAFRRAEAYDAAGGVAW